MLNSVNQQLQEKNIKLEVSEAAKDFLGSKGYDEVFGARPLRRVIQNLLEDKLADELLRSKFRSGDTVIVDLEGDELSIHERAVEALSSNGNL